MVTSDHFFLYTKLIACCLKLYLQARFLYISVFLGHPYMQQQYIFNLIFINRKTKTLELEQS